MTKNNAYGVLKNKNVVTDNKTEEEKIKEIMDQKSLTSTLHEDTVKENIEEEKMVEVVPSNDEKVPLKSLKGRPRIHKEELVSIAPKVDHRLHMDVKKEIKENGYKMRDVLIAYMTDWIKTEKKFDYKYELQGVERKSHGLKVTTAFRDQFSHTALKNRYTQTYVIESIYKEIKKDLIDGKLKI